MDIFKQEPTFNWVCPFCNHDATITDNNFYKDYLVIENDNIDGRLTLIAVFIICPNKKCRKYKFSLGLFKAVYKEGKLVKGSYIKDWNLIPLSEAKEFPDYIPKPIIDDYKEACLIKDLSPKASATLARRCLQTMVRDFWGVKGKPNLKQEIESIKDKVDSLTWDAIEGVRNIGNIGAHMEKDINLIIDVDPDEANLLIRLIESLIKDWYITKHEHEENLKKIIQINKEKDTKRKISETNNSKNEKQT